jgi:hypothetical protein
MQIMQFGGASWAVLAPWQQHQAVFGVYDDNVTTYSPSSSFSLFSFNFLRNHT